LDIRKYVFIQRVVNNWNGLPAKVVNSKSVNAFKNAYDRLCCNDMDVDQLASPSSTSITPFRGGVVIRGFKSANYPCA